MPFYEHIIIGDEFLSQNAFLFPLRWKTTNPPFLSNSLVEKARFLLAMWWDGEPHPQSAPQWVP
jgi:hypothetical protein